MTQGYTLYGAAGGGSMIVEACFAFAALPVEYIDLTWDDIWDKERSPLTALNPLAQVPTLVMPGGEVLTETAAILLHLADRKPGADLVPPADHALRPAFLRWLIFLVSAVYPTFTYGDEPKRWVATDDGSAALRTSTDAHRQMLWRHVEDRMTGPWFLGETWSALDLYLWVMTYWRPGRPWFAAQCPKIHSVALAMDAHPLCQPVFERNGRPSD